MLQWRTRQCCLLKMNWNVKRSILRTSIIALICAVFLFAMFLFVSQHDLITIKSWSRDTANSVSQAMRRFRAPNSTNNRSTMSNTWRENAQVSKALSAINSSSVFSPPYVTGLGIALNANGTVYNEKRTGNISVDQYKYMINEPNKCKGQSPFLILLITAEPGQTEARRAIRQTWGNESNAHGLRILHLFLLGFRKDNDKFQQALLNESRQYRDIIQQDFLDTYNNLTIKTLMGMNWVGMYCPHASYVMKTDSDMFVNIEYLISKLLKPEQPPRRNYFTGYIMRGSPPIRNKGSKWYMPPEVYPGDRYPVFCSGTGYVFSADLAGKIFHASLSIRRLHLEDVYVGICLAKLRIDVAPPPNVFLFNNWRVPYSSCKYSQLITSHHFQPSEIIKYCIHLQQNKHNACTSMTKIKRPQWQWQVSKETALVTKHNPM